jgi:HNH endonuclease
MPARDARRRFGRRERAALLLAAAGCCAECGELLDQHFHADHRDPWVRGGRTDVTNGQALCPTCNRRKSDKPALSTTPATGPSQAASDIAAASAVVGREQHNQARPDAPAFAGVGLAPECHQEIR